MLSTELLPSIPKYKKLVMSLKEKTHVIDELYSGISYSAVEHEFNVNQSKMYTLGDFPSGPVVKTPSFHCRGCRFDPWSGN